MNNSYAAEIEDNKNLENTEVLNRSPIVIFDLNDLNHRIETEWMPLDLIVIHKFIANFEISLVVIALAGRFQPHGISSAFRVQ